MSKIGDLCIEILVEAPTENRTESIILTQWFRVRLPRRPSKISARSLGQLSNRLGPVIRRKKKDHSLHVLAHRRALPSTTAHPMVLANTLGVRAPVAPLRGVAARARPARCAVPACASARSRKAALAAVAVRPRPSAQPWTFTMRRRRRSNDDHPAEPVLGFAR